MDSKQILGMNRTSIPDLSRFLQEQGGRRCVAARFQNAGTIAGSGVPITTSSLLSHEIAVLFSVVGKFRNWLLKKLTPEKTGGDWPVQ